MCCCFSCYNSELVGIMPTAHLFANMKELFDYYFTSAYRSVA